FHVMGMQLGVASGNYFAGIMGDHYGWRGTVYILAGAGLLVAFLCGFFLRDAPPERQSGPGRPRLSWIEGLGRIIRVPSYLFLTFEALLGAIGSWIFSYWLPLFYKETFAMSLAEAALHGTVAYMAGLWSGTVAGGWVSDRVT